VLCPALRTVFPELAWVTGNSRGARLAQAYAVFSFATVMAFNSGGAINLALNLALTLAVGGGLYRLARPALRTVDARPLVVFEPRGFVGLCLYLLMLYVLAYRFLRPEGLPSVSVQIVTLGLYGLAAIGLWRQPSGPTARVALPRVDPAEGPRVLLLFGLILALAFALSGVRRQGLLGVVIMGNFVIWTPLGWCLTLWALLYPWLSRHTAARVSRV